MAESDARGKGGHIFISYRREDSREAAGRLVEDLGKHFARELILDDIPAINPGTDFVEALQALFDACGVLLVVIGPRWLTAVDQRGRRRLDLPDDWIYREIAEGLQRPWVRVVPVLVDDAVMPTADELPAALLPLARRQAFSLTTSHWGDDVGQLVQRLSQLPGDPGKIVLGPMPTRAPPAAPMPAGAPPSAPLPRPNESLLRTADALSEQPKQLSIFFGTDRAPSGSTNPTRWFGRTRGSLSVGSARSAFPLITIRGT